MRFMRLVLKDSGMRLQPPIQAIALLEVDFVGYVPRALSFKVLTGTELTVSFETLWDNAASETVLAHDTASYDALAQLRLRWLGLPLLAKNPLATMLADRMLPFGPRFSSLYDIAELVGLPLEMPPVREPSCRSDLLRYVLTAACVYLLAGKQGRERLSAFLVDMLNSSNLEGPDREVAKIYADDAVDQIRFIRWKPPVDDGIGEIEF